MAVPPLTRVVRCAEYDEVDMKASNVRGLGNDGLRKAGMKMTHIAQYNIVPGVGPDQAGSRYIFDAYRDESNKFRDTRKFAKMNNPDIPRGHSLNLLTGITHPATPPAFSLHPSPRLSRFLERCRVTPC